MRSPEQEAHAFRVAMRILSRQSDNMPLREHLEAVNASREAWRREALVLADIIRSTKEKSLATRNEGEAADEYFRTFEGESDSELALVLDGVKAHDARETEAAR